MFSKNISFVQNSLNDNFAKKPQNRGNKVFTTVLRLLLLLYY